MNNITGFLILHSVVGTFAFLLSASVAKWVYGNKKLTLKLLARHLLVSPPMLVLFLFCSVVTVVFEALSDKEE